MCLRNEQVTALTQQAADHGENILHTRWRASWVRRKIHDEMMNTWKNRWQTVTNKAKKIHNSLIYHTLEM